VRSEIIAAGNKMHDYSEEEEERKMEKKKKVLVFLVKILTDQGKPQEIRVRMSCKKN